MIRYDIVPTAWGSFVALFTDRGLRATVLPNQRKGSLDRFVRRNWPDAVRATRPFKNLRSAVARYFSGRPVTFDLPIDLSGMTDFQQCVLEACQSISYGQVASYADLARAVGSPRASRAVGSTMAINPLPLIVPCHRVVRSDGSLGGFSAPTGVNFKRRLLNLEGASRNGSHPQYLSQ